MTKSVATNAQNPRLNRGLALESLFRETADEIPYCPIDDWSTDLETVMAEMGIWNTRCVGLR